MVMKKWSGQTSFQMYLEQNVQEKMFRTKVWAKKISASNITHKIIRAKRPHIKGSNLMLGKNILWWPLKKSLQINTKRYNIPNMPY